MVVSPFFVVIRHSKLIRFVSGNDVFVSPGTTISWRAVSWFLYHSGSYLYQVIGDLKFADRVRTQQTPSLTQLLTMLIGRKNNLQCSSGNFDWRSVITTQWSLTIDWRVFIDMWSRQYLQQQNQIGAKNMNPWVFGRLSKINWQVQLWAGTLSRTTGMYFYNS